MAIHSTNLPIKSITVSVLAILGWVILGSYVTRAQQQPTSDRLTNDRLTSDRPTSGRVLSVSEETAACAITLIDDEDQISTQLANIEVCEQDLVGQHIELTYGVTQIEILPPPTLITVVRPPKPTLNVTVNSGVTERGVTERDAIESDTMESDTDKSGTIEGLPDGNYRYWNGPSNNPVVSAEELLANGGVTFHFRKTNNNITGIYDYVYGEALCVQGQVNDNMVTGISVQNLPGATVLSEGVSFASFGREGFLQVRQGRQLDSDTVHYNSTALDLTGFNRINAGTQIPPNEC